ncbi:tRNA nucleotidyltransferase (CCA-adding enzyme) [Paenibacillus uliginis N3/975]|uniref:tRNA nucleotidyltransferase (CCA-adding enzyme) n=1 Tax=Paenibacillus uliginis N3/975 TaxID=1313296 RepID=A0A1X7HII0_9BACL|nr:tRNA nucleotidyltransferase (CCA-adding enzyme) [Paenibacillus uliginis N3/975]
MMAEQHQSIVWQHADSDMAAGSAKVIRTLNDHGYEAYWVGGCVRDEYMGRKVSDMDITTSALPEMTSALFPRVVPTGIKHGTVTVIEKGQSFEVTTYRIEGGYEDHRRPTQVFFVSEVEEDLKRRDFTMNAMALGIDGIWVDPFGGRKDIDLRIIRCVGDARVRFREDALRMIRCIRFASVFGFSIAKDTWKGILADRETLSWIAMERIRSELDKMMSGPNPLRGLELIKQSGLYASMKVPFPFEKHDPKIIGAIPEVQSSDLDIRWALLIHGCGILVDEADKLLREWTFSNRRRETILGLLKFQERWFNDFRGIEPDSDRLLWINLVLELGTEIAEQWLCMQEAVQRAGQQINADVSVEQAYHWLNTMNVRSLKDLQVTGSELLQALERRGGPWMGKVLQLLLVKTAAGFLPNDKDNLIEEAKRVMNHEEE